MNPETYLVTGGAGFIGSHLVEHLVRRGAAVRVVDNFVTGNRNNLAGLEAVELIEGDLADAEVARRSVAGVAYVLHQAAIPSVPRSVEDPLTSHRANIDATLQLLIAARDAGVRRVVYAASSSAYGDTPTLPKVETMATAPRSPYALQKLVGEQYAELFTKLYGLETASIRYFNVFGPRQDPESPYSGVIARFITALIRGARPTIYGDGEQTRDFTYIDDIVAGVLACMGTLVADDDKAAPMRLYNLGNNRSEPLMRFIAILEGALGHKAEIEFQPIQRGDVKETYADITAAARDFGFAPKTTIDEGLPKLVAWYHEHYDV